MQREAISDKVVIRPYETGDEQGIVDCYNAVFHNPEAGIPKRSLEHWNWKFRDNPVGMIRSVVAEHADEGIIGSYTAIPYRIRAEGRQQVGSQGVDMMVLPQHRRLGKRPGLFTHLGLRFHELYCGRGEDEIRYTYGWPMGNWKLGQKYRGYINIRDWDLTFLELGAEAPQRALPDDLETLEVERFADDVDGLWSALEPKMGLATIRDARYLNWRYTDCPDQDYRLYECRERGSGTLRGIAVYTVTDFIRPNTGFIADWLNHEDDVGAMLSLLAPMERQAVADQVGVLASVWNHVDLRFVHIQHAGYKVKGTPYFLVLASFKWDTHFYRDNWYLTIGDSDLI